jgi:alginate O-acetyltransferase complex protein AlgI
MITMLLGGIWHGADWKFVAWGALHGGGLVLERFLQPWSGAWAQTRAGRLLVVAIVFHFVCLGWLLFRADNFSAVGDYLGAMVHPDSAAVQATPLALGLLLLGMTLHGISPDLPKRLARRLGGLPLWAWSAAIAAGIVGIDALGPEGVAPFIYFQF